MQVEELVLRVCGFDDDGERVRVYFDEPNPLPLLGWEQSISVERVSNHPATLFVGVRALHIHLYGVGEE